MNRPAEDRWFELFRERGDVAALAKVFDATSSELARVARHLCRDVELAEDAVQSTFLAAIDERGHWDATRPLLPWLLGLLTNRVREQRRRDARRPEPDRVAAPAAVEDPLEVVSRREVSAEVRAALAALDQPFREALERRLFRLQTAEEIARDLGIAAGTVRMRIHRGMERLRQRLPASLAPAASAGAAVVLPIETLARMRSTVLQAAEASRAAVLATGSASVPTFSWTAFVSLLAMHKSIIFTAAGLAALALAAYPLASLFGAEPSPAPRLSVPIVESIATDDPQPVADPGGAEAPPRRAPAVAAADRPAELHLAVRGDGQPLDRIRIEIVAESAMPYGDALAAGTTDAEGIFRAEVPAGRVAIRVPALDEPHAASLDVPPEARVHADLDLAVQLVAKVTVLDRAGRPLGRARITGRTTENRWSMAENILGETRADGTWQRAFVSRQVEIRAVADGHVQSGSFEVGAEPIEIRLEPGAGSVLGTVYDTDGTPAPDAEVVFLTESDHHLEARPQGIRCDAQGRFRYDHLPAGTVTLIATRWQETSRGNTPQITRSTVEVVAGAPAVADLHFGRGTGAAQIELRGATGAPLPDVFVSLLCFDRELPGLLSTQASGEGLTDAHGQVRITDLIPGRYQLQCSPGGQRITRDLQIVAGETAVVVASLQPTSNVDFRVRDDRGRPLEGLEVSLTPATGGQVVAGTTDTTGRVRLAGVGHGDHEVRVRTAAAAGRQQGAPLLTRRVTVTGATIEELRVNLATLSEVTGLVTTDGRVPLAGLEARLLRLTDQENMTMQLDAGEEADQVRFRFEEVPPGTWLLTIRREAQDLAVVESIEVVGDGAPIDVGSVELGVGSTTLQLSRADGEAVRDAVLVVRLGDLDLRRIGIPPQNKRIRVVNMPSFAPAEAFVWGSNVAPTPAAFRIVADESLQIPVTLEPGTPTTLILPAVDPAPPVRQGVYEWTRDGVPFFREQVLDGGRLTRGLPPGSYRITFESLPDRRRAAASFEVGAEAIEVRLAWE